MLSHRNKHGENPKTRREQGDGSGMLAVFVSRYRFTAVFAIWGNWSISGSHRKVLYGSNGGGAKQEH